jgi:hypothetical protein
MMPNTPPNYALKLSPGPPGLALARPPLLAPLRATALSKGMNRFAIPFAGLGLGPAAPAQLNAVR